MKEKEMYRRRAGKYKNEVTVVVVIRGYGELLENVRGKKITK